MSILHWEQWESLSRNPDIPKIIRSYERGHIDKKTAKAMLAEAAKFAQQ